MIAIVVVVVVVVIAGRHDGGWCWAGRFLRRMQRIGKASLHMRKPRDRFAAGVRRILKEIDRSSIVQHRHRLIDSGPAFPVLLQDALLGLSAMRSPEGVAELDPIVVIQMAVGFYGAGSHATTEMGRLMVL